MPGYAKVRGFSLIEVLVAFVLLSLALAVILQVFSNNLRNIKAAEQYTKAMVVADSRLAILGSIQPIESGETSGSEGGFDWRMEINPHVYEDELDQESAQQSENQLFEIKLTVQWQQGNRQPAIQLSTMRIGQKP